MTNNGNTLIHGMDFEFIVDTSYVVLNSCVYGIMVFEDILCIKDLYYTMIG